jgi:hypothetical protein
MNAGTTAEEKNSKFIIRRRMNMRTLSIEALADHGRIYGILSIVIALYVSTLAYFMHYIGEIM